MTEIIITALTAFQRAHLTSVVLAKGHISRSKTALCPLENPLARTLTLYCQTLTQSTRLHSAGCVDRISKETVARHLQTNNSSHSRSRVDTNPQLKPLFWHVTNPEVHDRREQVEGH